MTDYLIQSGSNHVYVSTPELLKRKDMMPYDFEAKGHPKKEETPPAPIPKIEEVSEEKEETQSEDKGKKPEDIIETLVKPEKEEDTTTDKPGINAIKAELEAIEDPSEMVSHVFKKYGVKLTRTMRKDTMIDRTLKHIGG